jgi:hypothetical protein
MISIKIYRRGNDLIIAACDENLLGKRFEEGKFQLEVTKEFYEGERIDIETFKKYLLEATIANLVGNQTIKCAIESGIINSDCVIKIGGIPHAQMVKMLY